MDSGTAPKIVNDGMHALLVCPHDLGRNFQSFWSGFVSQQKSKYKHIKDEDNNWKATLKKTKANALTSWFKGRNPCDCKLVKTMFDRNPSIFGGSTEPQEQASLPIAVADQEGLHSPEAKRRKIADVVQKSDSLDLETEERAWLEQACKEAVDLGMALDELTAQVKGHLARTENLQYFAVERIQGLPVANSEEMENFERNAASVSYRQKIKEQCEASWEQFMIDRLFTKGFLQSWKKKEEELGRKLALHTYRNTIEVVHDILKLRNPQMTRLEAEQTLRKHIENGNAAKLPTNQTKE